MQKNLFLQISQNSQENTCAGLSVLKKCRSITSNFIKIETLAQAFSCEFFLNFLITPFL